MSSTQDLNATRSQPEEVTLLCWDAPRQLPCRSPAQCPQLEALGKGLEGRHRPMRLQQGRGNKGQSPGHLPEGVTASSCWGGEYSKG